MYKELTITINCNEFDSEYLELEIEEFTYFLVSEGVLSISHKPFFEFLSYFDIKNNMSDEVLNFNLLIPISIDEKEFVKKISHKYNISILSITKLASEKDWIENSKQSYLPTLLLDKIWIGATWQKELAKNLDDEILKIFIDPGMAFGTGSHPTTKLCIDSLVSFLKYNKPSRLLDLGCGTGVLSIIACKLGLNEITLVDNDNDAIKITKNNFLINNLLEKEFSFYTNLNNVEGKFDLIISNILLKTLAELSSIIINKLDVNGVLILSGILNTQSDELIDVYKKNSKSKIVLKKISTSENWVCLSNSESL